MLLCFLFKVLGNDNEIAIDNNEDSGQLPQMMAIKAINNTTKAKKTLKSEKEKLKVFLLQLAEDIKSMEELSTAKIIAASIQPTVMALRKH